MLFCYLSSSVIARKYGVLPISKDTCPAYASKLQNEPLTLLIYITSIITACHFIWNQEDVEQVKGKFYVIIVFSDYTTYICVIGRSLINNKHKFIC